MTTTTESESTTPGGVISPFKIAILVSTIAVFAMLAISAWVWTQLPADSKVPIHWNASGEADGWAGRGSLFLVPGMVAFTVVLLALVPFFEPRRGHLLRSSKAYLAVWYGLVGFFMIVHGAIAWAALGNALEMNAVMGVALGSLFIVIGNYMGKVRSNYMFGFRTPWTLSSELSWNKTHRLGGRLFVLLGIALLVGGFLNPSRGALWIVMIAGIVLLIGVTFTYSYIVWKNDPDKEASGRR